MNLKTSLILAFVFMALGTVVFYDAIKWQPERMEAALNANLLFPYSEKKVEWLELYVPSATRERTENTVALRMVCGETAGCTSASDQKWKLDGPTEIAGDATYIGALLGSVYNVKRMDEAVQVTDPTRLQQNFQVDPEKGRRITIKFSGEEEPLTLVFGGSTPVDSNYYLWTNKNPEMVEIIPHYFYRASDRDAFHWQSKSLLPKFVQNAPEERRLRWRSKNIGHWYECEPRDIGESSSWRCRDQDWVSADNTMLDGLYQFASSIRASARATASPQRERQLKRDPLLELTVGEGKDQVELKFYQSGKNGIWLAKSSETDWLGLVSAKDFERFQKPIVDYRWRSVLSRTERDRISKVEVKKEKKLIKSITESEMLTEMLTPLSRPVVESFHQVGSPSGRNWQKHAQWQLQLFDANNNMMRELTVWTDGGARTVLDGEANSEVREVGKEWTETFLRLVAEKQGV